MPACDIECAISEFLADAQRTSLELPHMTTGQRKLTKKLVQDHPELRCESYGFGSERQLHLFKIPEGQQDEAMNVDSLRLKGSASPDRSTVAPSEASSGSRRNSPPTSSRELPFEDMQHVMQIRNTFIDIKPAPVDERVIQSMPRNMFRQCLLAEASARPSVHETSTTTAPALVAEPTVSAGQGTALTPGALVIVEGLVKLPAFNGQSAIIQSWDEASGRYNILLTSTCGVDGSQQAKIKADNLRVVLSYP